MNVSDSFWYAIGNESFFKTLQYLLNEIMKVHVRKPICVSVITEEKGQRLGENYMLVLAKNIVS